MNVVNIDRLRKTKIVQRLSGTELVDSFYDGILLCYTGGFASDDPFINITLISALTDPYKLVEDMRFQDSNPAPSARAIADAVLEYREGLIKTQRAGQLDILRVSADRLLELAGILSQSAPFHQWQQVPLKELFVSQSMDSLFALIQLNPQPVGVVFDSSRQIVLQLPLDLLTHYCQQCQQLRATVAPPQQQPEQLRAETPVVGIDREVSRTTNVFASTNSFLSEHFYPLDVPRSARGSRRPMTSDRDRMLYSRGSSIGSTASTSGSTFSQTAQPSWFGNRSGTRLREPFSQTFETVKERQGRIVLSSEEASPVRRKHTPKKIESGAWNHVFQEALNHSPSRTAASRPSSVPLTHSHSKTAEPSVEVRKTLVRIEPRSISLPMPISPKKREEVAEMKSIAMTIAGKSLQSITPTKHQKRGQSAQLPIPVATSSTDIGSGGFSRVPAFLGAARSGPIVVKSAKNSHRVVKKLEGGAKLGAFQGIYCHTFT